MSFGKKKVETSYTPIGLSISEGSIHAIQFRLNGDQTEVHAEASQRIQEVDGRRDELHALQAICAAGNFEGREAVSALPAAEVAIRNVVLPEDVDPDLDYTTFFEALTMEARSVLPYSPENALLDYLPQDITRNDDTEGKGVLLFAARRDVVNRHFALLKEVGLRCLHLDVAPCAAARVVGDEEETWSVVDFDTEHTNVSIVRGSKLFFSRTVKFGVQRLIEQLMNSITSNQGDAEFMLREYGINHAERTNPDFDDIAESGVVDATGQAAKIFEMCSTVLDTFAVEIRRSLDYFQRQRGGSPVSQVVLIGNLVPKKMDSYLSERLSIPVTSNTTYEQFGIRETYEEPRNGSAMATAAGLALREIG